MSYLEWIRGHTGKERIWLAFASVVLRDAQERVLLQRRTDFTFWGLPGGILEPGESILQCAHRELAEETGLTAGPLSLVGVYSDPRYEVTYPNGDQVQQYTLCFQGLLAGGEMQPDGIETSEQRFFAPTEIPWDQLPLHYADMVRDALAGDGPVFLPPYSRPETIPQIETIRPLIGTALYIGVGAMAVVVREDGRVLMSRRCDDGYWDFPGGYCNLGENAAHTAVRETAEETGLVIAPQRILGIHSPAEAWVYPNGDQVQGVVTFFKARPAGGEATPDRVESAEIAWLAPAEILALPAHPMYRQVYQAVVAHLNGGHFIL